MQMQIHDDKIYFNTVSPEPVEARPPSHKRQQKPRDVPRQAQH